MHHADLREFLAPLNLLGNDLAMNAELGVPPHERGGGRLPAGVGINLRVEYERRLQSSGLLPGSHGDHSGRWRSAFRSGACCMMSIQPAARPMARVIPAGPEGGPSCVFRGSGAIRESASGPDWHTGHAVPIQRKRSLASRHGGTKLRAKLSRPANPMR